MGRGHFADRRDWRADPARGFPERLRGADATPSPRFRFEEVRRYGWVDMIGDSAALAPHVRRAGGGVLGLPGGSVQGPDATVYVVDRDWRKIVAFRPDGTVEDVLLGGEGEGPGELRLPVDLAMTANDELAVGPRATCRIGRRERRADGPRSTDAGSGSTVWWVRAFRRLA